MTGTEGSSSGATAVAVLDRPEPVGTAVARRGGVSQLRRARRRRRLGDRDWGELAYRAYTTSLGTLVTVLFLSGVIGDEVLDAAGVADFVAVAPGWIGLVVATFVLFGVRSGTRGGPIAMEAADVQHLLAAPVDRSSILRRPAAGTLGYGALAGALVGGLGGSLLDQRIGTAALPWVGAGALFAVVTALLGLGTAMVVSSRTVPRIPALAVGWALVGWAVADVAGRAPRSPTAWVGTIVVWPEAFTPVALVAVPVAIAISGIGLVRIGGLSIELARRRTSLVGQLRFAATQQDLRTVVLLRRQLAAERPRRRPWLPGAPRVLARRAPVAARDLASIARWPLVRVLRVVGLGTGAALALRGVWAGTTPLVLVAGVAAYVAALDASEPMAQEIDHPGILSGLPSPEGVVLVRHLAVPALVMVVVGGIGTVAAWAAAPDPAVWWVASLVLVPAALCAVAGAAITVLADDTAGASPTAGMVQPEIAGPRLVIRTVWPPAVAVAGTVPVLVARASARSSGSIPDSVLGALPVALACVGLAAVVFVWVRFRADLRRAVADAGLGSGGAPA
jgi:hypothetical protein